MADTKTALFLTLPRELRDEIYRLVLHGQGRWIRPVTTSEANDIRDSCRHNPFKRHSKYGDRADKTFCSLYTDRRNKAQVFSCILHTDIIATNHQIYSETRDILLKENRIRLNIYDADLTDGQREVFSTASELYIWTPSLHLANNSFVPILQSRTTPVKYLKLAFTRLTSDCSGAMHSYLDMNRVEMLHHPLAQIKVSNTANVSWDYEQFTNHYVRSDGTLNKVEYEDFVDELERVMLGKSELKLSGRIAADRLCSAHPWDDMMLHAHSQM